MHLYSNCSLSICPHHCRCSHQLLIRDWGALGATFALSIPADSSDARSPQGKQWLQAGARHPGAGVVCRSTLHPCRHQLCPSAAPTKGLTPIPWVCIPVSMGNVSREHRPHSAHRTLLMTGQAATTECSGPGGADGSKLCQVPSVGQEMLCTEGCSHSPAACGSRKRPQEPSDPTKEGERSSMQSVGG